MKKLLNPNFTGVEALVILQSESETSTKVDSNTKAKKNNIFIPFPTIKALIKNLKYLL